MQLHRVMMCFRVRTVIINTEAGLICFLFFFTVYSLEANIWQSSRLDIAGRARGFYGQTGSVGGGMWFVVILDTSRGHQFVSWNCPIHGREVIAAGESSVLFCFSK